MKVCETCRGDGDYSIVMNGEAICPTCNGKGEVKSVEDNDWTEAKSVFDVFQEILTVTGDDVLVINKDKEDK